MKHSRLLSYRQITLVLCPQQAVLNPKAMLLLRSASALVRTLRHNSRKNRERAFQHALSAAVRLSIGVAVDAVEVAGDAQARGGAEIIDKADQFLLLLGRGLLQEALGSGAARGHREEFGADVDKAAKQHLLAFELGAEADHRVEQSARETAACAGDESHVALQHRMQRDATQL